MGKASFEYSFKGSLKFPFKGFLSEFLLWSGSWEHQTKPPKGSNYQYSRFWVDIWAPNSIFYTIRLRSITIGITIIIIVITWTLWAWTHSILVLFPAPRQWLCDQLFGQILHVALACGVCTGLGSFANKECLCIHFGEIAHLPASRKMGVSENRGPNLVSKIVGSLL